MKEKIIIDGVDVSGCKDIYCGTNCGNTGLSCPDIKCENNPNCYYKQLARKTEECEKLQAENEELKRQVSNLKSNECHLKNETKKYKKGIHKYKIVLRNKIDDLELSRREFLRQAGRYPNFYKDEIKKALDNFNKSIQLINNDNRYKQALKEIKAMLETIIEINKIVPLQNNLAKILQKCEVLNDIN